MATGPPALSLPLDSLIGWWELRDATTSGGNVTGVTDKSGNGNDLATAGTGNEITLAADADYGGELVGVFAIGKYLQRATFVGGAEMQPNTVLVLGEWADASSGRAIADGGGTSTRHAIIATTAAARQIFAGGSFNAGTITTDTVYPHLVIFDGASSIVRVSSDWTATTTGNPGSNDLNGITLGNRFATLADSRLSGRIAIAAAWSKALSADEIAECATYLNNQFGQNITV